jgi:hypothetical protein
MRHWFGSGAVARLASAGENPTFVSAIRPVTGATSQAVRCCGRTISFILISAELWQNVVTDGCYVPGLLVNNAGRDCWRWSPSWPSWTQALVFLVFVYCLDFLCMFQWLFLVFQYKSPLLTSTARSVFSGVVFLSTDTMERRGAGSSREMAVRITCKSE